MYNLQHYLDLVVEAVDEARDLSEVDKKDPENNDDEMDEEKQDSSSDEQDEGGSDEEMDEESVESSDDEAYEWEPQDYIKIDLDPKRAIGKFEISKF